MATNGLQARWLALSIQAGAWERDAIADRFLRALPVDSVDPEKLAARVCFHFDGPKPPSVEVLTSFLLHEPALETVFQRDVIRGVLLDSPVMAAKPASLVTFPLPELATWRDVGDWLALSDKEIAWFADCHSRQANVTDAKLHHYRYTWVPKKSDGFRLIESPKSRLKAIQRKIVADILNRVPPHAAAHGFCRGRSAKTFVSPHVGQEALLRLDLKDFFQRVPVARIGALLRCLGYPPGVARLLRGFCTNAVSPAFVGEPFRRLSWQDRKRLQSEHLAQGAPTSPALANLCAWRLDVRLTGVAERYGLRYTRYADDLAFSGRRELARRYAFIEALVASIAMDEGFLLNHRKTTLRLASQRQHAAGIVINEKSNVRRADWDRLKATLHNCVRYGPASQNHAKHPDFQAHLRGRLAYMLWLNPARGEKLWRIWDQIKWED